MNTKTKTCGGISCLAILVVEVRQTALITKRLSETLPECFILKLLLVRLTEIKVRHLDGKSVPVVSMEGHASDDDDDHNDGAHHGNYHDTHGRLTGHVVDGDWDDLNVTGDVVIDDDQEVVGVAMLEVPQDGELTGGFHDSWLITGLVASDVVPLGSPGPAVEPGGRAGAVDVEVEQHPVFQHLVAGHTHVADGLFGSDFFLEDCHLDLVIGPTVLIPELQSFLIGVVQQTDRLLLAAVIKVGDHVHLHVVFPGLDEIILKMSL